MLNPRARGIVSFEEFQVDCYDQDVFLDKHIITAGLAGESSKSACYTPTPFFAAVAEAGVVVRTNPYQELATQPIELPPVKYDKNLAALTLVSMINASIRREKVPGASFTGYDVNYIDSCLEAEVGFADTFTDLLSNGLPLQYGQLIMNRDTPVFLRKPYGEPSSLALRNFSVNGIPYPAGSIARVELAKDRDKGGRFKTRVEPDDWERLPLKAVAKVAFTRLSAFALKPGERRRTFSMSYDLLSSPEAKRIFNHQTIEELAALSAQAIRNT